MKLRFLFTSIALTGLAVSGLFIPAMAVPAFVMPAFAQERDELSPPPAVRPDNYDLRLGLARQMHEIRPVTIQVNSALEVIAEDLPPEERVEFYDIVLANMDLATLERQSIVAMAQIFTRDELQVMLDYFRQEEAVTIEEKSRLYRQRMDPQVIAAVNDSLDRLRANLAASLTPAAGNETLPPPPTIVTPPEADAIIEREVEEAAEEDVR